MQTESLNLGKPSLLELGNEPSESRYQLEMREPIRLNRLRSDPIIDMEGVCAVRYTKYNYIWEDIN